MFPPVRPVLSILDVNPGSGFLSTIADPTPQQQRGGGICCPTFFCSHKYHKFKIILFLKWKRKLFSQFTKKYHSLPQKLSLSSKNMDVGSRIRDLKKCFSKFRIQGSKRHRITDPVSTTLCPSMNLLLCNWMRGGDHYSQHPPMRTVKNICKTQLSIPLEIAIAVH